VTPRPLARMEGMVRRAAIAVGVTLAALMALSGSWVLQSAAQARPPRSPQAAADEAVSGRISLAATTIHTGGQVRGQLVLRNPSSHPLVLDRGCPGLLFTVALSGPAASQSVAWPTPACASAKLVARPGITRYRFSVPATYLQCTMVGHHPPAGSVQCLAGDAMPPLPPGRYEVSFVGNGFSLAHLRAARIRLLPR